MLALAVVASGAAGGLYLYTHETLASVAPKDKPTISAVKKLHVPVASKPAIALVAGYDHRGGTGSKSYAGSNSDTLMLLRADPIEPHALAALVPARPRGADLLQRQRAHHH